MNAPQQIGQMAAAALDDLEGDLIGAVLLVATTVPDSHGHYQSYAIVPDGQAFPMTLGIIEGWRLDCYATVTASAVALDLDDDEE